MDSRHLSLSIYCPSGRSNTHPASVASGRTSTSPDRSFPPSSPAQIGETRRGSARESPRSQIRFQEKEESKLSWFGGTFHFRKPSSIYLYLYIYIHIYVCIYVYVECLIYIYISSLSSLSLALLSLSLSLSLSVKMMMMRRPWRCKETFWRDFMRWHCSERHYIISW